MAEFHLHRRIGETRIAVSEHGRLVEMQLLRDGDGLAAGACITARLCTRLGPQRGIAEAGEEILVEPWPQGATEGERRTLEITRAAWKEPGRERLAKGRPTKLADTPSPDVAAQLRQRGIKPAAGWPPALAEQFDDCFEQAKLGQWRFAGGSLSLAPTPAFLTVDVDGAGADLHIPAMKALAAAIRLWGLGGNLVVDLPTTSNRQQRIEAADAFDAAMGAHPFERTAVNGFGLLQVICPKPGPSILERARLEPAANAAIELLNQALADPGTAPTLLEGPAQALAWIRRRPHLLEELCSRAHRTFALP